MKTADKTNAMRLLERAGVPYAPHAYDAGPAFTDGPDAAEKLGAAPERVFKTLVACGQPGACYVFVIPVNCELNLKAAARAVGVKALNLAHAKDLFALTGYVRGGCSPLGMKKRYPTVFDASALRHDAIFISAGRIGCQIEAAPQGLIATCNAAVADIAVSGFEK